ncbi:atrial natriuretic peptide-converting enzyme-like [Strongylocentrotus purpuratus]|uniref:Uncharacterized protein n=1 Tax=Strongylocentrotus purpuratus TaxID=7668 RepID=A0A7M7NR93_STRPU|nr:atrial natriuretic peptide-converting enzyme-like [Strongylocentrotus purpuratus]
MRFTSDDSVTHQGFQLQLTVIPRSLGCGNDSFTCINNNCVLNSLTCDGYNDCGDFSDEEYCPPCVPLENIGECGQLPYDRTYFSNQYSPNSPQAVLSYNFIIHSLQGCHPRAIDLACNLLFPECIHQGPTNRPCYSDCVNITAHCRELFEQHSNMSWPVNCKDFTDKGRTPNGYCQGATGDLFKTDICGTRPAYRQKFAEIVGGVDANEGEFPWMVYLKDNGSGFCGGTLISSEWVVTAAHCVSSGSRYTVDEVVFGNLNIESTSPYRLSITPSQIFIHPDYDSFTNDADIALIQLSTLVNYTDYIRPACLANSSQETTVYKQCIVSGWGNTQIDGYPDHLQKAVVGLISRITCGSLLGIESFTDNMICAGYERGDIDTCDGDSGGPLACEGPDGRWHLVGVTSWGYGCAEPGSPGVYARVSELLPFILGVVKNYAGSVPPTLGTTTASLTNDMISATPPANSSCFECASNYECVYDPSWVCDGIDDCDNREDELNCIATPPANSSCFECASDYECVPDPSWVCDGIDDCFNREDELNCTATPPANSSCFECASDYECVPDPSWVCDGIDDCFNREDELNCTGTTTASPTNDTISVSVVNLTVGETRSISSPNYPNEYPNNAYYTWYITAPSNYSVLITFIAFNLESGYDHLSIGNGHTPGNLVAKTFSGQDIPASLRLYSSNSWMRFTSDYSVKRQGFQLQLTVIPGSLDLVVCPDGTSYNSTARCNSIDDCNDGSDENNCSKYFVFF